MSLARSTRFSPLNSLRLIPDNDVREVLSNTWRFDRGFLVQQVRDGQTRKLYCQKWQAVDYIAIYCDSLADTVSAQFVKLDGTGAEIISTDLSNVGQVEGNIYRFEGEDYTFTSFYGFLRAASGDAFIDGIYLVKVTATYDDGETVFYSEPVHLRNGVHADTILVECQHFTNDPRRLVMWQLVNSGGYLPATLPFTLRIPARLDDPEPGSDDTMFITQQYNPRLLKSTPYRRRELLTNGIPAYQMEKLNYMLGCDKVKVEGIEVVKEDKNTQISTTKTTDNQLMSGKIYLREVNETNGWTFVSPLAVELLSLAVDGDGNVIYPYAVSFLGLASGGPYWVTGTFIVADGADEAAKVAMMTNALQAQGARGSLKVTDDHRWVYNPAMGESVTALPGMYALAERMDVIYDTSTIKNVNILVNAVSTAALTITDFGDGTAPLVKQTDNYFIVHNYGAGSEYTTRVFHTGNNEAPTVAIKLLQVNIGHTKAPVKNITTDSKLPATVENFAVHSGLGYDPFNTLFLATAREHLKSIILGDDTITGPNPISYAQDVFAVMPTFADKFSTDLLYIFIAVADDDSSTTNSIINAFFANTDIGTGGYMAIRSSFGSSPATGPAAALVPVLIGDYGWNAYDIG